MSIGVTPVIAMRRSQFRPSDLNSRCAYRQHANAFSIIETINVPGKGLPRHKHPEAEISVCLRDAMSMRSTDAAFMRR